MRNHITVFGNFVVDLMARAPHLPVPGKTVKGSMFKMGPGGKGFNQGVAAKKAGADVTIITKVGMDVFGRIALDTMKDLQMDTGKAFLSDQNGTGSMLIMVDEKTSQNSIVVTSGACGRITPEDVASAANCIKNSQYLLTQLGTNYEAMEEAVSLAYENGVKIILNPAPIQPMSDEVLKMVEITSPNEVEAEILTGISVDCETNARKAAEFFFRKGVKKVVITLGKRGAFVADQNGQEILPVPNVSVVDTTGAGDAFNGGLVTALAEGKDLWKATKFANALASISVTRLGTTPSMPDRTEIGRLLSEHLM